MRSPPIYDIYMYIYIVLSTGMTLPDNATRSYRHFLPSCQRRHLDTTQEVELLAAVKDLATLAYAG